MTVGLLRPDSGTATVHGIDVWADPTRAKALLGVARKLQPLTPEVEDLARSVDDNGGPGNGTWDLVLCRGLGKGHASVLTRAKDDKQASRAAVEAQTRFSVLR